MAALESKGFIAVPRKRHVQSHFCVGGKDTGAFTFVSRGSGREDIGDSLLSAMAGELGIRKADFERLVDCTWNQSDLQAELARQGEL